MMARGWQGAMMRGFGAVDHEVTVLGTEYLTPKFVRVRMASETLLTEHVTGPTSFVRLWVPDPDGSGKEYQRGYTLSQWDDVTGEFACDFVLHEPAGPASAWAAAARPGDRIAAMTMGSHVFEVPDEAPAGYLVLGDAASIPALDAILATVPAEVPIEVYLEEHEPTDRDIPLRDHPRAEVRWVPRAGAESFAAALEPRDYSDWAVWAGAETGSLKHLRARLTGEFGFPKREVYARGYWTQGRDMGTEREAGPDVVAEPLPTEPDPAPTAATPSVAQPAPGRWRSQAGGRLLAPLKRTFVLAGILQGLFTLLELVPFVLLVELARLLLAGAPTSQLWTLGVVALVLLAAGSALGAGMAFWLHSVDARFARDLRSRLLDKLARIPLGWFSARGSGSVKQLVQDDTLSLHYLVTHAIPDAVGSVVAPVAVLVYLFAVDWRIALALFIPVLVHVVTMYVMIVASDTKPAQAQRWAERMNDEAAAHLEGQRVVRVFGGVAASSFRTALDGYITFLDAWQRPFTGKKTVMDLATRPATFLLVIAALGTLLVNNGSLQPVDLLPFLLLGTTFGGRLLGIGYGLGGIRDALVAARRLQVTLDEEELTQQAPGVAVEDAGPGEVVLREVSFGYRRDVPVLQDVSLHLRPGTITALVGASGSGKSTLAGLIARFHDVNAGAVLVGGRDVRGMPSEELYARVGFVFQDTQLVRGTVHENIALARPDATAEAVEAAARAAQIHERILRLPEGYETVVGHGVGLSGGERQRLTIARAILADTPVLVLDEATAYADPESEFLVQRALGRLSEGRTVLVIAHRLHTITEVDQIVVLDHGRVVQQGRHEELLAQGGRYAQLWEARAGERVEVRA